jgi:hypothetical protein
MSTSSLTQDTRDFPLGSRARREIERRVREAQEKLTRTRRGGPSAATADRSDAKPAGDATAH